MKKLFTLLTLTLLGIGSAWADGTGLFHWQSDGSTTALITELMSIPFQCLLHLLSFFIIPYCSDVFSIMGQREKETVTYIEIVIYANAVSVAACHLLRGIVVAIELYAVILPTPRSFLFKSDPVARKQLVFLVRLVPVTHLYSRQELVFFVFIEQITVFLVNSNCYSFVKCESIIVPFKRIFHVH